MFLPPYELREVVRHVFEIGWRSAPLIATSGLANLGITTAQGTEGVGRASTRSVVLSSILIIVTNVVLVRLIFFLFPIRS